MNQLKLYREKRHFTQEELSEISGISVRTIQRIEAGNPLKGYTLRTLAKHLECAEEDLIRKEEPSTPLKWINLSSLLILPPLNLMAPYFLSKYWKVNSPLVKQMIDVQFMWSVLAPIVFFLGIFLKLGNVFTIYLMAGIYLSNVFIILYNTYTLDQRNELGIRLRFSIF